MNLPGEFVRRAAATVSSIGGGIIRTLDNSDDDDEVHITEKAKDRVSLTLKVITFYIFLNRLLIQLLEKGTPSKDALTTAALSVKHGFVIKRNEQGVWQKRLFCIVPHTLLYYYDNEHAESPRGVIDLHYYTIISIEGQEQNILKLTAPEETGLRFVFGCILVLNIISHARN
jgi:hypothetical protein